MANGESLRKNRESPGFFMPGFSIGCGPGGLRNTEFQAKKWALHRPEKSIDA